MENYTITKEQVLAIEKVGGADVSLYLKEQFPEAFKTELEVGKWYKHIHYDYIFCFNGQYDDNSQYGITGSGEWTTHLSSANRHIDSFRLATPEEIKASLINEAKKKGFVEGVEITWKDKPHLKYTLIDAEFEHCQNPDRLMLGIYAVMDKGEWAEIIPQETKVITMDKAVKILSKKYGKTVEIK